MTIFLLILFNHNLIMLQALRVALSVVARSYDAANKQSENELIA